MESDIVELFEEKSEEGFFDEYKNKNILVIHQSAAAEAAPPTTLSYQSELLLAREAIRRTLHKSLFGTSKNSYRAVRNCLHASFSNATQAANPKTWV